MIRRATALLASPLQQEQKQQRAMPFLLEVEVGYAQDLLAADRGTSNPYCEVSLLDLVGRKIAKEGGRTRTIQGSLAPTWGEKITLGNVYDLANPAAYPTLRVAVMSAGSGLLGGKNTPLGKVEIPLETIVDQEEIPLKAYELKKDGRKMTTVQGRILLKLNFTGDRPTRHTLSGGGGAAAAAARGDAAAAVGDAPIMEDHNYEDDDFPDNEPNVIRATVVAGRNLQIMDKNFIGGGGSSDPMVTLKVGKEKKKTTIKHKCLTPMWNESFDIPCNDPALSIEAILDDHDKVGTNDFMGKVILPLLPYEDKHLEERWYKLLNEDGMDDGEDRGELRLRIKWEYHPEFVREKRGGLLGLLSSSDSEAEDDDDDGDDPDLVDDGEEKSPEEAEKEAQEKKEAEEKLKNELGSIEIKSGDYQIQVHIIEARDLKAEDVTGLSDPVVYIECLDQKQNTEVKEQTLSCVWDEVFIFNFKALDKEEFEMGQIKIRCMDADTFKKNDLIGSYVFDASYVYFQQDHEIYRTWVALMDDDNPEDVGVQGYLKLSVVVVGPGDKAKVHDEEEERRKEQEEAKKNPGGLVLMPPVIKKTQAFFVTSVYRAEGLPVMDSAAIGSGGIDAFFQIEFGDAKPARTKVKTMKGERSALNPVFNYELWVPVSLPTMTGKAKLSMWDYDRLSGNDIVATAYLDFGLLQKLPNSVMNPYWLNLYGAPVEGYGSSLKTIATQVPGIGDSMEDFYNTYPDAATMYKGRVLLGHRIEKELPKGREEIEVFRRKVKKLQRNREPPNEKYVLKAVVVSGTELPQLMALSEGGKAKLQVKISIGQYAVLSSRAECREGVCEWNQVLENQNVMLPAGSDQLPDVFIHLCRGSKMIPICFARIKAQDLIDEEFDAPAKWFLLQEDKALDALSDGEFPGTVLIRLGFGGWRKYGEVEHKWQIDSHRLTQRRPYQVRVHCYQGRSVPAADSNGLCDPYLKVNVVGQKAKTRVIHENLDPMWYETHVFEVALPEAEFMPQVNFQLFDQDTFDKDDYLGTCFLPIKDAIQRESLQDPLPDPVWHDLLKEVPGDCEGQLLLSVEIVAKSGPGQELPPPDSIVPDLRKSYVEVIALGCRDLPAYQFVPMQSPFLEFELAAHDRKEVATTEYSKRPSGQNPNFLERLLMEVELPEKEIFAPQIQIRCRDVRLGGYMKPVVGVAHINLQHKLPWTASYEAPQMEMVDADTMREMAGAVVLHEDAEALGAAAGDGAEEKKDGEAQPLLQADGSAAEGGAEGGGAFVQEEKVVKFSRSETRGAPSSGAGSGSGAPPSGGADGEDKDDEYDEDDEAEFADESEVVLREPEDLTGDITGKQLDEDTGAGIFTVLVHMEREEARRRRRKRLLEQRKKKKKGMFGMLNRGGTDVTAMDDSEEEEEEEPEWMVGRRKLKHELEEEFGTTPFETYWFYRGQSQGGTFGSTHKPVGRFKGLVRVIEDPHAPPLFDMNALLKPRQYVVRLYVLEAKNLTPMDMGFAGRPGKSDPYLIVKLGKNKFDDRENFVEDVTEVDFYKCIEFGTELPGASQLEIRVMDADDIGSDDLIGKTIVDLEDRWFDQRWQELGMENRVMDVGESRWQTKPIENRSLYIPTNNAPQGNVNLWVDIMPSGEAGAFPQDDIALPPRAKFQVRLVIWKTRDVVAMDTLENMNDLFVRVWLEGTEEQDTDTHWRCKKGKGSFNWRMLFEVELGHNSHLLKFPYLHFQMWDKDILKWNDCIAEGTIDVGRFLRKAYKRNAIIKPFETLQPGDGDEEDEDEDEGVYDEIPEEDVEKVGLLAKMDAEMEAKEKAKARAMAENKRIDEETTWKDRIMFWRPREKKVKIDEKEPKEEEDAAEARNMVNRIKEMTGLWDVDPPDSTWLHMDRLNHETSEREPMGSLCFGFEVWPSDQADSLPVGSQRNSPNHSPYLPPPTGRLKFSWNPFVMGSELCGPALCAKIFCFFICAAVILLSIFCQPFLNFVVFVLSG